MLSKTLHNDSGVRTMNREMLCSLDQRFYDVEVFYLLLYWTYILWTDFVMVQSKLRIRKSESEHSDRVQGSGDTVTEPT